MRVGFLSRHDPRDPGALSGMPYSTWEALTATGVELVDLSESAPLRSVNGGSKAVGGVKKVARALGMGSRLRLLSDRAKEIASSPWDHARTIAHAEYISDRVQALLDSARPVDVLFGVCTAQVLYRLETQVPIVYTSDATARLLNATYPGQMRRSQAFQRACEEIEHAALHACTVFSSPSRRTAQSAIDDYGVPPERVRVVEMGAHVVPDDMPLDPSPPSHDHLELVLVAAAPKRKRLGLCIEIAKELRARGWNATLNFVGPHDPALDGEDIVNWAGRLQLSDPDDRRKHKDILRRSHWMLLPSIGEAFGIAPAEAAHFGRPSIVTDVGGLPTVVQHEHTGIVVPVDAPAAVYADAIAAISSDPARYGAMSQAALHRAQTVLSWPMWAKRMLAIFEEVAVQPSV